MAGCGVLSPAGAGETLATCCPAGVEVHAPRTMSGNRAIAAREFQRAVVTVFFTRCRSGERKGSPQSLDVLQSPHQEQCRSLWIAGRSKFCEPARKGRPAAVNHISACRPDRFDCLLTKVNKGLILPIRGGAPLNQG